MANPSASAYNADAIEVLSGLDPVRKRPGMYTDTSRPNHLAQEVIDNSVDEALAGHARSVQVILHADHSLEVSDDGRGMPVDIHPEEGVSGVELILTKLHVGGKFSNKNYQFSGGLHGVGISVVNALSTQVRVRVKRDGNEYQMTFADGFKASELEVVGSVGKRNTGTSVYFSPDPKYFDSPKFSISRLKHVLKAKAVLCPGLLVSFEDKASGERWNGTMRMVCAPTWSTRSTNSSACPTSRSVAAWRVTRKRLTGLCCGCPKAATAFRKATST